MIARSATTLLMSLGGVIIFSVAGLFVGSVGLGVLGVLASFLPDLGVSAAFFADDFALFGVLAGVALAGVFMGEAFTGVVAGDAFGEVLTGVLSRFDEKIGLGVSTDFCAGVAFLTLADFGVAGDWPAGVENKTSTPSRAESMATRPFGVFIKRFIPLGVITSCPARFTVLSRGVFKMRVNPVGLSTGSDFLAGVLNVRFNPVGLTLLALDFLDAFFVLTGPGVELLPRVGLAAGLS